MLYWRFDATLPPADHPAPRDAVEARLQDLDYLARLTTVDRSFSPVAAARFRRRVDRVRASAASLDRARFLMGVSEAVAAADNAHTNVDSRAWREQLSSVPVRFEWFAEGLFVIRAKPDAAELLGAHVVAIDGFDPEALAREAARYFGGFAQFAHTSSLVYLESPEAIRAVHADAPRDRLALRVIGASGRERSVDVAALPPPQRPETSKAGRLLSPVPPSLRDPEHSLYATRLDEHTLYLHLWQVRDDASGSVGSAMMKALGEGGALAWRRIVLDLRFDRGGDYPTVYGAMRAMPQRLAPDGKLLALTDNTTFSAAIIVAALAKHFGDGRTTLVGEKPGDRLAFWAEGNSLTLPNSRIRVTTPTAYHDWAHGCRELRCFWPNFWYDVGVGSVDPGVAAAWRFADYRRGTDTVLQRALER